MCLSRVQEGMHTIVCLAKTLSHDGLLGCDRFDSVIRNEGKQISECRNHQLLVDGLNAYSGMTNNGGCSDVDFAEKMNMAQKDRINLI